MLYFPGNSVRMAVKAATLPMDAAIFDLEDAVSIDDKETARIISRDVIGLVKRRGIPTFVRVNSLGTGLTVKDVRCMTVTELDGFMLAKTETASDVAKLCRMIGGVERSSKIKVGSMRVIALIETAKGVLNSFEIASASERVVAVAFGAGDYYRDLGKDITSVSREENELLYARSHIVNASRALGVQAIDTPFLGSLTDKEAFLAEVKLAAQLGFKGKQCIHPSQIQPINSVFSPSKQEVDRARRIVEAFEEAQSKGLGVMSFEGKMVDRMNYRQAKDLLENAQMLEEREKASEQGSPQVHMDEIFTRK
jgi:citrate lyase beta subunit